MQRNSTRRGFTQEELIGQVKPDVKQGKDSFCNVGLAPNLYKGLHSGFTLIELLVVVIIIAILAAIALPQYQKAVRKAKLSEVATTFNALSKAVDVYLLENGFPKDYTNLLGTTDSDALEITIPCVSKDSESCYTRAGKWDVMCGGSDCTIYFSAEYHGDGTTGNTWLDGQPLNWSKDSSNNSWLLEGRPDIAYFPEVCRWWKDLYGSNSFYGDAADACPAYF